MPSNFEISSIEPWSNRDAVKAPDDPHAKRTTIKRPERSNANACGHVFAA